MAQAQPQQTLLVQRDPSVTSGRSGTSAARARLIPLRVQWEDNLQPNNRTSQRQLQTLLRQSIYPDVPIMSFSVEQ